MTHWRYRLAATVTIQKKKIKSKGARPGALPTTHDSRHKSEKAKKVKDQQMSSTNIIQWNIQGISQKKQELVDIIANEKPATLCIQEAMLSKQTNFKINNYNGLFKEGHINRRSHKE